MHTMRHAVCTAMPAQWWLTPGRPLLCLLPPAAAQVADFVQNGFLHVSRVLHL